MRFVIESYKHAGGAGNGTTQQAFEGRIRLIIPRVGSVATDFTYYDAGNNAEYDRDVEVFFSGSAKSMSLDFAEALAHHINLKGGLDEVVGKEFVYNGTLGNIE